MRNTVICFLPRRLAALSCGRSLNMKLQHPAVNGKTAISVIYRGKYVCLPAPPKLACLTHIKTKCKNNYGLLFGSHLLVTLLVWSSCEANSRSQGTQQSMTEQSALLRLQAFRGSWVSLSCRRHYKLTRSSVLSERSSPSVQSVARGQGRTGPGWSEPPSIPLDLKPGQEKDRHVTCLSRDSHSCLHWA